MLGKLVNTSIGQNVLVLRPLAQMELLALLPVIWRDRVYLKHLDIKGLSLLLNTLQFTSNRA